MLKNLILIFNILYIIINKNIINYRINIKKKIKDDEDI